MKRLSGRGVPPANSVPIGTAPIRPPRRRPSRNGGRSVRRFGPRTVLVSGAGAVALGGASLALLVSGYFLILTVAAVVAASVLLALAAGGQSNRLSETRLPMIQDLLKGLFGPQAVPAPTQALPQPEPVPAIEAAPPPAPPKAKASDNPRLPTVARPAMVAIEGKIERILETLGRVELGDMTQREMTDLRDVHLPALVASYVDIPADHRAQIFKEKGKSASYVLKDSLDVISSRLDATIARLAKREISTFDDANRFITDRYGNREDPFE